MIGKDKIRDLLKCTEGTVVEYKTARGGFPESFWESFSAFATTDGGIILLGVKEDKNKRPVVDGLTEQEAIGLKKKFWDMAHNPQKVSDPLLEDKDAYVLDLEGEGWVLVCDVPRAAYDRRPVFLNGRPYGNTFKRRHEGDYHCTDEEVRQMFADANLKNGSTDARILKGYTMDDIDLGTLHKYRKAYDNRHENHPWSELSDIEFLKKVEAWRKDRATGEEGFTVAGIMMFGKTQSVTDQECMPWFFPDYREHLGDTEGERWSDRIYPDGTWEVNVYQFFTLVFQKLSKLLPKPFRLASDGVTRLEYSPAHTAVREALANALIHAQHNSKGNIVVDSWSDRIVMSNPGSMLVSVDEFYEGQHSVCRNPLLQKMFVFIGVGEKAGSGADVIVKGWEDQKWTKPVIEEHSEPDRVEIVMRMVKAKKISKDTSKDTSRIQVGEQVLRLIRVLMDEMSVREMMEKLELKNRSKFVLNYLNPALEEGVVAMTQPDSPKSPTQKYYLTELGKALIDNDRVIKQPEWVSEERVNRLITEFAEALPRFPIGLPAMEEQYKASLPVEDVRCFYVPYLMKKEMFKNDGSWIYNTPELYLTEIQTNIWQHYNVQFLMHQPDASYQIRFSEIKESFKALGVDGRYAVITSFYLGTFDDLYGGDVPMKETEYGYQYGDMAIYRVPSHEARMIVMRKELLPRFEAKVYEGDDKKFKLINEQHLLYSNIFNMEEKADGLGLIIMRDLKFYYPKEEDFHYVKLMVDRMERVESELDEIKRM